MLLTVMESVLSQNYYSEAEAYCFLLDARCAFAHCAFAH